MRKTWHFLISLHDCDSRTAYRFMSVEFSVVQLKFSEHQMFLFNRYVCTVLLLVVLFAVMGVRSAMAHEGRNVGDYNFIVGFILSLIHI